LVSRSTGFKAIGSKGVDRFRVSMDFGGWDSVPNGEHVSLLKAVFSECRRVLKSGGTIIVFYDIWKVETLATILKDSGFRMLRLIEWLKTNPVPLNAAVTYLSNAREVAVVATKGSKPVFNAYYHRGVFEKPIHRDGGKRIHPTQKPLGLMEELIEIHTERNSVVLDPFAGSGTTLLAALNIDRIAWGSEIDDNYYRKAVARIEGV